MRNNYHKKKTKKSLKKNQGKGTKIFLKKKKTKSINMVVNDIRIFQRMSIKKNSRMQEIKII